MANKHKTGTSAYQRIAMDLAEKIADGRYRENEIIYGRSMLAASYSVSPETIRRAAMLLQEWGIASSEAGSGIRVISSSKAAEVAARLRGVLKINEIKNDISMILEEQRRCQAKLEERIETLLDYIEKHSLASPILPYEISINENCLLLGKKISEVNFWQQTGVTVVGINRGGRMLVSPGPNAVFEKGDVFIFVGPEGSFGHVYNYLYR